MARRAAAVALVWFAAGCGGRENVEVRVLFSNASLLASTSAPWPATLSFTAQFVNGRAGVSSATTVTVNRVDVFVANDGGESVVASFRPSPSPAWDGTLASGETRSVDYSGTTPLAMDPTIGVCGQSVRFLMTLSTTATPTPLGQWSSPFTAACL